MMLVLNKDKGSDFFREIPGFSLFDLKSDRPQTTESQIFLRLAPLKQTQTTSNFGSNSKWFKSLNFRVFWTKLLRGSFYLTFCTAEPLFGDSHERTLFLRLSCLIRVNLMV